MQCRKMTSGDIPTVFQITYSSREKSYTPEGLTAAGITETSTTEMLDKAHSHEGWICETDGKAVGFIMDNITTGEIWVLVVLPEYERQGIGAELYTLAIDSLIAHGWKEAWLGILADIQKNGYAFFKKRGWKDAEMRGDFLIMKKSLA